MVARARGLSFMKVRAIVVAVAVGALPVVGSAQTVRSVQPVVRNAAPVVYGAGTIRQQGKFHPAKLGPHTYYGTITAINGTSITMRTRRQRTVIVDATTVLADGSYSAPLFVGKLVTIDGNLAAGGVFTAAHIFRMTNLNALPDDH